MRIVHTSDWHAGRSLQGQDRLGELAAALDGLAEFIEGKHVDLLLMSGDVFESGAPHAEAERVVFHFLRRVGSAGTSSVVIAGNHDSPARLEAWGTLAELALVRTVARPRPPTEGGAIEIESRDGQRAVVAAIPFAFPRYLVSALKLAEDETKAMQQYADRLRRITQLVCAAFRADTVNLLVAHAHIEGAILAGSERQAHVGDQWAATPQALPPHAHYVALGHIHRPQSIPAAPSPTYYAGSVLQLDFGEAGEEKSFVVIEATPGAPANIVRVPYPGTKPLVRVQAALPELEARADSLRTAGWLEVTVPLEQPDPDFGSRVRRLLPNAIRVRISLPTNPDSVPRVRREGLSPRELYRAYHMERLGSEPDPIVLDAFDGLYEEALHQRDSQG